MQMNEIAEYVVTTFFASRIEISTNGNEHEKSFNKAQIWALRNQPLSSIISKFSSAIHSEIRC